jgi:hypothetical protein
MRAAPILLTVFLSACQTMPMPHSANAAPAGSPTQFTGPNGRTAFEIPCAVGVTCYQKAKELCPNGYTTVDHFTDTSGFIGNGTGYVTSTHYLVFECN